MPMTWACLEELGGTWGAHAERRGQSRGWALDLGVTLSSVGQQEGPQKRAIFFLIQAGSPQEHQGH